jgi:hypothetical protein
MTETTSPYVDEWGHHLGYCNSCGEETELGQECDTEGCVDGEVVPYDDDPDPET